MTHPRYRNYLLLFSSLLFYAWGEAFFVFLMIFSILLNYIGGVLINHFRYNSFLQKAALGVTVIINIVILIYYKYFGFIFEFLNSLGLSTTFDEGSIHLPIGISFFTFQNISYLVDLYRKEVMLQRNPFHLGLYISLFPQLIAGPIVRYHDIAEQIKGRTCDWQMFYSGVTRFTRGLGKKVLIANSLALIADQVFTMPVADIPTPMAWIGIICYSLQIYFDFSGYSDMAIGLGRMFGFNFMENFNYPYISKSIQEFWRRWHISLSSWFRDYVYIPLGGSRVVKVLTYRNLIIVFFLTGLWHGASWNFIVWGLFHGFFLILERLKLKEWLDKVPAFVQHTYTLTIVLVGWVLFRAEDLTYALGYLKALCGFSSGINYKPLIYFDRYTLFMLVLAIVFSMPSRVYLQRLGGNWLRAVELQQSFSAAARSVVIYVLTVGIFILCSIELAKSSYNPFIYFRF
ncbi:MBOAT family O-acyltransferase [Pontibacter amylolyticus]|uniref:MBOAT family O-acyltransferase n=1 Tax=Pontibacter amylolyticus TaxID=1424080 RepID=UPI001E2CA561|nr:MBOAT family O-acyltransferase [Pontibacter amylolyticus]